MSSYYDDKRSSRVLLPGVDLQLWLGLVLTALLATGVTALVFVLVR